MCARQESMLSKWNGRVQGQAEVQEHRIGGVYFFFEWTAEITEKERQAESQVGSRCRLKWQALPPFHLSMQGSSQESDFIQSI